MSAQQVLDRFRERHRCFDGLLRLGLVSPAKKGFHLGAVSRGHTSTPSLLAFR
ncbi:MAG: hypothetical protein QME94_12635 [Anaerolineae bacterium]|nr:hypothetical protein [Anaerolineae bacterium]